LEHLNEILETEGHTNEEIDMAFHGFIRELFCWEEKRNLIDEIACPVNRFLICLCIEKQGKGFLHVREIGDDRLEALLALDRGRRPGRALKLDDVAVPLARLGEPGAGKPALEIEVGRNAGDEEGFICCVDVAIGQENRNAGLLRLAEHLIPTGDDNRRDDDGVDLLGDERPNSLELLLFLALGVGEFEVDSFLLRLFLHVLGKGRAPIALVADLRKADGDREGRRPGDHEAQADGSAP